MEIKRLEEYIMSENTYVVINGDECIVIDPSYELDGILKAAGNAKITHIFLTHCHYDHIRTLNELRAATGAKLVTGKNGSNNIGDPYINLTASFLDESFVCDAADIIISDGEEFTAAGMKFKMIYTPGHTNCSVCYITGDNVFTGDTLFLRSTGRTDLPTGDEDAIVSSIMEKLYTLDDEMKVYPGHNGTSSIGYEKKFNLYIRAE